MGFSHTCLGQKKQTNKSVWEGAANNWLEVFSGALCDITEGRSHQNRIFLPLVVPGFRQQFNLLRKVEFYLYRLNQLSRSSSGSRLQHFFTTVGASGKCKSDLGVTEIEKVNLQECLRDRGGVAIQQIIKEKGRRSRALTS